MPAHHTAPRDRLKTHRSAPPSGSGACGRKPGAGAWSKGVALSGEASTPARIEMRGSRLSPELMTPAIFHSTGVSFTWRAHTWLGLGVGVGCEVRVRDGVRA